jgi:hypothetical protein
MKANNLQKLFAPVISRKENARRRLQSVASC